MVMVMVMYGCMVFTECYDNIIYFSIKTISIEIRNNVHVFDYLAMFFTSRSFKCIQLVLFPHR